MEVILATFQSSLDKKLEEESNLSAADKQALRDRFMTHFKQNLHYSLVTCYGKRTTPAPTPPTAAETEADQVERLYNAVNTATSRRARYPSKAAKMLDKTLSTNQEILRMLKADAAVMGEACLNEAKVSEDMISNRANNINSLADDIDECKRNFLANSEKIKSLSQSFQILQNNMN